MSWYLTSNRGVSARVAMVIVGCDGSWYRGGKGFVRVSEAQLRVLRNVVRASILYFLALKGLPKEQLLKALDGAVFDRREIEELRVKANGFWGLETSEERILSAQW